jgi:hypothetical protein
MSAQLEYKYLMDQYLPGQRADAGRPVDAESHVNPISAQVNTLTFGGTETDGTYSVLIEQIGAPPLVLEVIRSTTPATNTDLATAATLEANANNAFKNLLSSTSAVAVSTLVFKHPGIPYVLTSTAPAPGTLVVAQTTAPGGSFQRVGMWVARASGAGDRVLTPITTGTVVGDLIGIAERTHFLTNGVDLGLTFDAYKPGKQVSFVKSGRMAVEVVDAVTPDSTPFVWIDETDPVGAVGQMAAAAFGGAAIDVSSLNVRFLTSAPAGGIAVVQVREGA